MPTIRSQFRLLSGINNPQIDDMTKSISAEASSKVRSYMTEKGLTVLGENSRRQVMGRGPKRFYKSLTPDSARRLGDFYPLLERAAPTAGFVPRLFGIERIDEQVSVACFEYVDARGGTTRDTRECLTLYAELQASAAQHSTQAVRALTDACRHEVSTWSEELLQSWDPVNWTDPKILRWAGADAAALTEVGVPALRSIPSLLSALSADGVSSPVHADLHVGNYSATPASQGVIFDWDEGYWGLPGMGLQILLREAMDDAVGDLGYKNLLNLAPPWLELGLSRSDLAIRTLASAVIEIAGVRQSLRELHRPRERHAAYLAAWACRYDWVIKQAHG
jgi:Phosphotransferase enzyme family